MEETEERCNVNVDSDTMMNAQRNLAKQGLTVSDFIEIMLTKASENEIVVKSKKL